ncbi:MAG TPA: TIGR00730 family Rossman fold protein [Bacteroidales bacterium]|nr:TIGR00730 family Rossman fold protein [Bacteroidales bacterium]
MTVCIFASSSSKIDGEFRDAAHHLGSLFARNGYEVIFGGGGIGLMKSVADAIIENEGRITGVIPSFMIEAGWDHRGVTDMIVTSDMGERKKQMFARANAVVALPGGIGTLEELTEAITLKQLGLFRGPIVILNTQGFYNSLIGFLDQMIRSNFLRLEHKGIWQVADTPEEVIKAISIDQDWMPDPRSIAKI